MVEIEEDKEKKCFHNIFYPINAGREISFIENKIETIKKLAKLIIQWNTTKRGNDFQDEIDFVEEFIKNINLSLPSFFKKQKMIEMLTWCKKQTVPVNPMISIEDSQTNFASLREVDEFIKKNGSKLNKEDGEFLNSIKNAIFMNQRNTGGVFDLEHQNGDFLSVNTKTFKPTLFTGFFDEKNMGNNETKGVLKIKWNEKIFQMNIEKKNNDFWVSLDKKGNLLFFGSVLYISENTYGAKFGIFSTPDSKITYKGDFDYDTFHGEGVIYLDKKLYYSGKWSNGNYHGFGRLYKEEKLIYQGNFVNSKKNGEGISFFNKKIDYFGNWDNDTRHGKGRSFLEGLLNYKCFWNKNLKEGFGIMYYLKFGTPKFIGHFKQDKEM